MISMFQSNISNSKLNQKKKEEEREKQDRFSSHKQDEFLKIYIFIQSRKNK